MTIKTIKRRLGFPEVFRIRKGLPKLPNRPGQDLKTLFRIDWGDEPDAEALERYREYNPPLPQYGDNYVVRSLDLFFPFQRIEQVFSHDYEGYAGRKRVCVADGERIEYLYNPISRQVEVSNFTPERVFDPGEPVTYYKTQAGKREPVFAKATGRLTIVPRGLGRFVSGLLITTSIYDIVRLEDQLSAIEIISGFLPRDRGIAGIQIRLTRKLIPVVWNKPDGQTVRVKHGLCTLEIAKSDATEIYSAMSDLGLPTDPIDKLVELDPEQDLQVSVDERDAEQALGTTGDLQDDDIE